MRAGVTSLFLFVALLFATSGGAQVLLELREDSLYAYSYSDGDEFNNSPAESGRWNLRIWPGTNLPQFFAYEPANTRVQDGVAVFSVTRNDSVYTLNSWQFDPAFFLRAGLDTNDRRFRMRYAAGSIVSGKKYHYGLYELRFRIEEGKGVWPAFWFYGGDRNEEIDVFELKGEKTDRIHVDTHCPVGCDPFSRNFLGIKKHWGGWLPVGQHLYEGFNIMMLDWQPAALTWYINGFPLARFEGQFANPMNLYINTQVASEYSAFKPAPDATTPLPNNFYVDYLRVWSATTSPSVLKPVRGFNVSRWFPSAYANKPTRRRGIEYAKKDFRGRQGMISLVLLDEHRLQVCALGELNNSTTRIDLKGAFGTYSLNSGGEESILEIDPRESALELTVTLNKRTYRHALAVRR